MEIYRENDTIKTEENVYERKDIATKEKISFDDVENYLMDVVTASSNKPLRPLRLPDRNDPAEIASKDKEVDRSSSKVPSIKKRKRKSSYSKKRSKRRKLNITPSMVTASGMNKMYSDRFSDLSPTAIYREKLMVTRSDKQKLEEKAQREALPSGRWITFLSSLSSYLPSQVSAKTTLDKQWWNSCFLKLRDVYEGFEKIPLKRMNTMGGKKSIAFKSGTFYRFSRTSHVGVTVYCKSHSVYLKKNRKTTLTTTDVCRDDTMKLEEDAIGAKQNKEREKSEVVKSNEKTSETNKLHNFNSSNLLIISLEDHGKKMIGRNEFKTKRKFF
jgi:hypothetical protein